MSSIILARHCDADRIICVKAAQHIQTNDGAYSTKDDERDPREQGKTRVPNTYMKSADPSPVPER